MEYSNKISDCIRDAILVKTQLLRHPKYVALIQQMSTCITDAFKNGKKLYLCGNGGSAADAQHIAAELSGRFYKDRAPLPAESLTVNTSFLTAVANDYGYDFVFERMIEAIGNKGDVLIGISTSGNSKNVVNAFKKAQQLGIFTIAWTGEKEGAIAEFSDVQFCVPSSDTPRIQETHILIGHILCELIEDILF